MSGSSTSFELCTESLGFESGDCSVGEGEEELDLRPFTPKSKENGGNVFQESKEEREVEGKKRKSFPPPLRWMSTNEGKQNSYMKSERKDGRLILTEVRIERPEVFQVSRENGRLRFCVLWTDQKKGEEEAREKGIEPVRREGFCSYQGDWSGKRMPTWWHHGFVTTS